MFGVVAVGTPGAQTHRDGGWQHSEEPHGALSPVPQRHGGDQGVKQPLGSPNPKGGSGAFGSPPGPTGAAGFPPHFGAPSPFWGSLSLLGLPPHLGAPPSSSFVQLSPPASPSMGSDGGLLTDPPPHPHHGWARARPHSMGGAAGSAAAPFPAQGRPVPSSPGAGWLRGVCVGGLCSSHPPREPPPAVSILDV